MSAIPAEQVDRRLIHAQATVAFTPRDEDGAALTIAASPAPAAVLKDGAGAEVGDGPSVSLNGDADTMTAVVPAADLDELDTFTIEWTATVAGTELTWETALQIAGGFHFGLAPLIATRTEFSSYAAASFHEARRIAEDRLEEKTKVAWVPRGAREQHRGVGRDFLILGHTALRDLVSLTLDGDAFTATELAALEQDPAGIVTRPDGVTWPAGEIVVVHYRHGEDRPPHPVSDATMTLAKELVVPDTSIPARAVLQATELGTFRLTTAGRDGPTGIPDVDAVIADYERPRPAIA